MLANNSPAILTGVGVAGVLSVAFLTGKATFAAADRLAEVKYKSEVVELSNKEKFAIVWKLYIPPTGVAVATIAAIIFSHRIDARRAAAIATAYTLSEKAWTEYRDKIVETLGKNKEQKARDEVAQERVTANPPPSTLIVSESADVQCLDMHSGRYFPTTMEKLRRAQVDTMYQIIRQDYASLSDFYDRVGLKPTTESDDIGWNSDVGLEIEYSHAMDDHDRPCITIRFQTTPFRY